VQFKFTVSKNMDSCVIRQPKSGEGVTVKDGSSSTEGLGSPAVKKEIK
jgi:hypothetical protein